MSENLSVASWIGYLSDESLLKCCSCQSQMSEPVTLNCLHSCCQSCVAKLACGAADSGQQTSMFSSSAKCPVCCEQTECSTIPLNNFLWNCKRLTALASELVYCSTCDDGVNREAEFWCVDCCKGLCDNCFSLHRQFARRHRSDELEVVCNWSISQLTPAAPCHMHKRPLEHLCFTCRKPTCGLCEESCRSAKHVLQPLSHGETSKRLHPAKEAIRVSVERLNSKVSDLQQKCEATRRLLQEARMKSKSTLVPHKRSLQDSTDKVYENSCLQVVDMVDEVEKIEHTWKTPTERHLRISGTVNLAVHTIEEILTQHLGLKQLLCGKHLLKEIANCCLSQIALSLEQHKKYWLEKGACIISGSLPLTSDIILRSCIGAANHKRAVPCAPLRFDKVSATIDPKVDCWDLAVTRDGHVLLAAAAHGLLVYSDRGQYLSTWRPAKLRYGRDGVSCVAALSDGRAAAGVALARHVVLLKRSEAGDSWQEDRRVTVLQLPPWRLAVHNDLLVAAECRLDQQQKLWVAGRKVKLLRLKSSKLLYIQSRPYDIARVALTALCVVTTSYDPVTSNSGAKPYLVEAFSHSGESLWRYETSNEEATYGLCVSAESCSHVYVTVVRRSDWSNSRVIAIGGADGKDRKSVMSNMKLGFQVPWHLSLSSGEQQRTVLAAAIRSGAVGQYGQARVVKLYDAARE